LPYFYLTQEDSVLLKETDYNDLFTSTFDVWEERVVETYEDYQSFIKPNGETVLFAFEKIYNSWKKSKKKWFSRKKEDDMKSEPLVKISLWLMKKTIIIF